MPKSALERFIYRATASICFVAIFVFVWWFFLIKTLPVDLWFVVISAGIVSIVIGGLMAMGSTSSLGDMDRSTTGMTPRGYDPEMENKLTASQISHGLEAAPMVWAFVVVGILTIGLGLLVKPEMSISFGQQVKKLISQSECSISKDAQDAIVAAQAVWRRHRNSNARNLIEAERLIFEAERAATPPVCDSARAVLLADKAKRLLKGTASANVGNLSDDPDEREYQWAKAAFEKRNYAGALRQLRPLAENGYASAQRFLGLLYYEGLGVIQDYDEALKWTRLAADQGDAKAQGNLGWAYYQGIGVAPNYEEALKWNRLAAEQGDAGGQSNLGVIYLDGQAVTQDYDEAFKWFKLAADQGDSHAQNNLGVMYANGFGVSPDYIRAHMWWDIAVLKGNENAASLLVKLQKNMTHIQIKKARDLAQECMTKGYKDC